MKKLFFAGLLLMGVTSCSVDNSVPEANGFDGIKTLDLVSSLGDVACGEKVTWPFGDASVGIVEVSQDGSNLFVKIIATERDGNGADRKLVQSRVGFYASEADLPAATMVGEIPNQVVHPTGGASITTYTYTFPITTLPVECGSFYIRTWTIFTAGGNLAEHFAGNLPGPQPSWYNFEYCVKLCQEDPPPVQVCETAFMKTGTTLISKYNEKPSNNNWGWYLDSNNIAADKSSEVYEIWAAAGQNLTSKGLLVGHVEVFKTGQYSITMLDGYTNLVSHVYRATSLPSKRQAPGLYKESTILTGQRFYLIIHMEACWYVAGT
ncbi:hypothetical protein [Gillisia mitskevichiae]|nr:hypothetical protein [Gillisia mitskevichiae]